jgi:hypothetical protein
MSGQLMILDLCQLLPKESVLFSLLKQSLTQRDNSLLLSPVLVPHPGILVSELLVLSFPAIKFALKLKTQIDHLVDFSGGLISLSLQFLHSPPQTLDFLIFLTN